MTTKRVIHRWFRGSFSTYCGLAARSVEDGSRRDRDVTCRNCLRSMGTYERRRLEWKEPRQPGDGAESA